MRNREGWKVKTLGEVCEVNYGTRVVKNKVSGTKYYVYGGGGATFTMDEYNREDSLVVSRFAMSQQCVRFVQGKFFLNDSGLTLSVKEPESLAQHFLNHHMFALNDEIYNLSKGVAQRNLDVRSFRKLEIKIPPLPTQHQIVAELDTLNSIIDKKKEQLNELDNLAQATFYDMFGDPVENEKGWEVKKLGEVCEITSSKRIFAREYQETGVPFYRSKEVIEKSKNLKPTVELFISESRYTEIKEAFGSPKVGDILMTAVGTIGVVWVVDSEEPFYFKDGNLLWLKMDGANNSTYFIYMLEKIVEEYKREFSVGSAYSALTIVKLRKISVNIPALPLQTQFAEKIKHIEQQKALIQRSIDDVQQLFDYTMDKYFN